jgi:hypothetical protein
MNRYGLGPLRTVILDSEYSAGLSIFVLVFPYHGVRQDFAGKPVVGDDLRPNLPRVSSISVGSG